MSLAAGSRLGAYEITGLIGAGGMGEVYQARDTRLDRSVAIKIIPDALASDPERILRFEREAKTLAALNHPNIAHIHGFEESSGIRALVMEFVDGPTLADRIEHGPIPLDEALPIAKQIADALEAAHESGIVHRDLKPTNVKVRADGTVKVLDFGLAKALESGVTANANLTHSPTLSLGATHAGVILGTAAYMAPEQARGRAADKRADIWAFGVVLYEMLTGRRAFDGDDVSTTLASVLKSDPDWSALDARTPAAIRRLLARCLQKDPKDRLHDIADARIEIDELLRSGPESPADSGPSAHARPSWWHRALPWAVASVLFIGLALLSFVHFRETSAAPEMRLDIVTPASDEPGSFALSPDGRQLVFVASGDGPTRLWLRPLAGATAQPLTGTDGATAPFWSPDSRSIGFFADAKLKRLDLDGGSLQSLANAERSGGAWNTDGTILFSGTLLGPLLRIPASGGDAVAVTKPANGTGHTWPQFLPDGRRFLFYAGPAPELRGIYLGSLDGSAPTRLIVAETYGAYAPSGQLLWARGNSLVAQRLDLRRRALIGPSIAVAGQIAPAGIAGSALSVSASGLIAFRLGASNRQQLRWLDRKGAPLRSMGAADDGGLAHVRIAPDGKRVAISRVVDGNPDIWLIDNISMSRVTSDPGLDVYPVWSPDSNRIVFCSNRNGVLNMYIKSANGMGNEELLVKSSTPAVPLDWSPDGRFLLYGSNRQQPNNWDLWILPMEGDRKPWPFLNTDFDERQAQFSPDGGWIAYASDETGSREIYVRRFEAAATEPSTERAQGSTSAVVRRVSTSGGNYPRWSPDGKELFYIGFGGELMAAPISIRGRSLDVGAPVMLFRTRTPAGSRNTTQGWQYDVSRDGKFLINTVVDDAASPITVLLNWKPDLRK
jgi:serine/threonine protein kinase